jgi:hypothetical protein
MVEFRGELFLATARTLYVMRGGVLQPVPIMHGASPVIISGKEETPETFREAYARAGVAMSGPEPEAPKPAAEEPPPLPIEPTSALAPKPPRKKREPKADPPPNIASKADAFTSPLASLRNYPPAVRSAMRLGWKPTASHGIAPRGAERQTIEGVSLHRVKKGRR